MPEITVDYGGAGNFDYVILSYYVSMWTAPIHSSPVFKTHSCHLRLFIIIVHHVTRLDKGLQFQSTPRSRIIGSRIGFIEHVIPMLSYDNLSRDWSHATAYFIREHCSTAETCFLFYSTLSFPC